MVVAPALTCWLLCHPSVIHYSSNDGNELILSSYHNLLSPNFIFSSRSFLDTLVFWILSLFQGHVTLLNLPRLHSSHLLLATTRSSRSLTSIVPKRYPLCPNDRVRRHHALPTISCNRRAPFLLRSTYSKCGRWSTHRKPKYRTYRSDPRVLHTLLGQYKVCHSMCRR